MMEAGLTIKLHGAKALARKTVLMNAVIIDSHGMHRVRIRDLTSTGARIAWDRVVRAGDDAVLKRGPTFVAARVAWSNHSGTGLEFYRQLSPAELAANFHAVFEDVQAAG
jgi:hypothetical protein